MTRCPECQAADLKSVVEDLGGEATCLGWLPFYDEAGSRHSHDPNEYRHTYRCSNGHSWQNSFYGVCWCGWRGGYADAR